MKFAEFKYERPNLETIKTEIEQLISLIGEDQPYDIEKEAIFKVLLSFACFNNSSGFSKKSAIVFFYLKSRN
jgi:hypothetical protein